MNRPRPVRIRLSRAKDFSLQLYSRALNGRDAINCARPSKWGNPFVVGLKKHFGRKAALGYIDASNAREAVASYRERLSLRGLPGPIDEIKGKNLACWCSLDAPCHCDVLIEIANRQPVDRTFSRNRYQFGPEPFE